MKKIVSVLLSVIIFLLTNVSVVGSFAENVYTYVYPDGSIIEYMLDSNLNPYIYENGEKVHIALALEHLEVTDPTILACLNSDLNLAKQSDNQNRALPTYYIDLSLGNASSNSAEYTKSISWGSSESVMTSILKFEAQHNYIRVRSTDLDKVEWYSSDNISFTYFYYYELQDAWYSQYYHDVDCNGSAGKKIEVPLNTYQYGKFQIWDDNNLNSFMLHVWTTYA